MRSTRAFIAATAAALLGFVGASATGADDLAYVPNSTKRVCQLTGDLDRATGNPTLSQTGKRFGVVATDLGSSFEHKGKLYFLFGDTWGRPGDRDVLAWTETTDPGQIMLDFPQAKGGKWLPLTVPGISQGTFEVPSGGISIADTIYVVCTTDHSEQKVMGRSDHFLAPLGLLRNEPGAKKALPFRETEPDVTGTPAMAKRIHGKALFLCGDAADGQREDQARPGVLEKS